MITIAKDDAIHLHRYVKNVNLVYMDPPFAVGIEFRARTAKGQSRATGVRAYDDKWPSIPAFCDWLMPRVEAAWSTLATSGLLWIHLDYRAVHEIKVRTCDLVGSDRFIGEVIWSPGNGNKSRKGPGVTHQTLLIFARGDSYTWNAKEPSMREPYAATSQSMHFTNVDKDGKNFRERTVNGKTYRYYQDDGRALGSVWLDCPAMVANTPLRGETTGYPTQKPIKLLDRIVRVSTQPGDLVADPFFGSGTTLVAARAAGRRAFGLDVGTLAHRIARKRINAGGQSVKGAKL